MYHIEDLHYLKKVATCETFSKHCATKLSVNLQEKNTIPWKKCQTQILYFCNKVWEVKLTQFCIKKII